VASWVHTKHGNGRQPLVMPCWISVNSSWKAPSGSPDMPFLSGPAPSTILGRQHATWEVESVDDWHTAPTYQAHHDAGAVLRDTRAVASMIAPLFLQP